MVRYGCLMSLFLVILSPSRIVLGQERSLYWRDLTVDALLDADGRLHLKERHAMVFTGDWNGGERKFRMVLGQTFRLERLTRVDPVSGEERSLVEGDLSQVDQYKWADSNTLRWRSRLPDSDFFDGTEIVYTIEYTLSNILDPRDGSYLLDHDFAFPSRSGMIQKFTLALEFDPPWNPLEPFVAPAGIGPLAPGESYVVTLPLRYQNPGKPPAVRFGAAGPVRYGIMTALAGSLAVLLVLFYRREKSSGRFEPLIPVSSIDQGWLGKNIFQLSPEMVGTIWDEEVGSAEVAAVLARLVAEGKLKSEIRRGTSKLFGGDVLHLKILDRGALQDYERDLVESLFFDGSDETDTDLIKQHYRNKGFDPSSKIRAPLEKHMAELIDPAGAVSKPSWKFTAALTFTGLALTAIACISEVYELVTGIVGAALILALYVPSRIMAGAWRRRLVDQAVHCVVFMIPLIMAAGLTGWMLAGGYLRISAWILAGWSLLCIAAFNSMLNAAGTRENPAQIRFRQKLAAAREFFRAQLMNPNPELRDAWYPYLIACGLGKSVDRWFRSYGSQIPATAPSHGSFGGSSGIGTSSSTGWTGGGGAFGGAGASGSWAAVAGSMAAGVPAPGSRSGGGGGHSGGGGGGGW